MPNHAHLIAVPQSKQGLAKAIGETHRRYTRYVNFREGWRGCLWQGRFASYAMDEQHLLAAARYIERNPIVAKMVKRPEDYPWSSARAHLEGRDDNYVKASPLLEIIPRWKDFLEDPVSPDEEKSILGSERTGRPLGTDNFLNKLESMLGRILIKKKAGRKQKLMGK